MRAGNWIPLSKGALHYLPTDRPFTELEALVSLQADYDRGAEVTISGYASLWDWSRGKVSRFLERVGAEIQYPESTSKKQNQNGQIVIQITNRSNVASGQIRAIDSRCLAAKSDRSKSSAGQISDRSQSTTINPNTDLKDNVPFSEIIDHLNERADRGFRANSKGTRKLIAARWKEGYRLEEFKRVIESKCAAWLNDPKMDEYLRPETLFGPKFESYLNATTQSSQPEVVEPTDEELQHRQAAQEAASRYGLE